MSSQPGPPHEWKWGDPVLSYFCLGQRPFGPRVEAAAAAGFRNIGYLVQDHAANLATGQSEAEMRAHADAHGVVVTELEALGGWATDDRVMVDANLDLICRLAECFGARHLQAVGPFGGDLECAARSFAHVCDRAADVGLRVALEFLPWTDIPDARVALDIVQRADRKNGGLCIDVWHHFRGANDPALLRAVPIERVMSLQLSDGPLAPESPPGVPHDYVADCLNARRPCGEGEFPLQSLLCDLRERGCDVPWSFEVLSSELRELPDVENAARILASARTLDGARSA